MSTRRQVKGVKPNGAKIKEMRLKANKSQKSLILNSAVELRTLQRAEEGKPVLPAILQQIAQLLEVPLTDLTFDEAGPENSNAYRLYNARTTGGRKLYSALNDWGVKYHYSFAVDPNSKLAAIIADAVRYFQSFIITSIDDLIVDPALKILSIGAINDQLAELEAHGVWVYFGNFKEWTSRKEDIGFGPELTGGGMVSPSNLSVTHHVKLRFSDQNCEYLTDTFFEIFSRDQAQRRAFKENIERGIHPDWLEGLRPFNQTFIDAYRETYAEFEASRPRLAIADGRRR